MSVYNRKIERYKRPIFTRRTVLWFKLIIGLIIVFSIIGLGFYLSMFCQYEKIKFMYNLFG